MSTNKRENRVVTYRDWEIPYELIRSERKSYAICMEPGGKMIVRVPVHMREAILSDLLNSREGWIREKYDRQCQAILRKPKGTPAQQKALDARYRQAANEYIPTRVAYYAGRTGGKYERITIREQKTRWGSCSAKGTLSFNWKLIKMPPRILDYVVVHELCHLTHMDHSGAFWQKVESILPDYRESRKWLKEHGSEF